MRPPAERRHLSLVREPLRERAPDRPHPAVVREEALVLAGEERVEGVVEVVRPDGGAPPAHGRRIEDAPVVPVVLRDDVHEAVRGARDLAHLVGDLGDEVPPARVLDRVRRVEPERVDVEVTDPLHRRAHHEPPDRCRPPPVVVEPVPPQRAVAVGEVRAELGQVVPLGPEVVEHDVEADGEAERVGAIDEALQGRRPAVALVDRAEGDPVVPPVALARERLHRHELDARDAELREVREPGGGRVERSLLREGPHVELVERERLEREPAPARVGPRVPAGVEERRWSVHALGLPPRGGVGADPAAVEHEGVLRAFGQPLHLAVEPAAPPRGEGMVAPGGPHRDVLRRRCPHREPRARRDEHRPVFAPGHRLKTYVVQRFRGAHLTFHRGDLGYRRSGRSCARL